ncbi:MAG: hypothetical protein KC592_06125 [Nitrospira sp.]|nr:hypothetical protein [Nitrospira sp.]
MPLVLLQGVFLLCFTVALGGCADWRDALQGYPNPEQWSPEGGPTRIVPTVRERGLLDTRFPRGVLRLEPVLKGARPEYVETSLADELVIHVLNIGAGSCQIVQCPHSHRVIVMDCGSSGTSGDDLAGEQIVNYAQANDLFGHPETEILVVISHPDQDHTNKIPLLLEGHSPQSIWLGGAFDEYTGPIGGFLDQADEAGVPIYHGWPSNFHNRGHPIEGLQCGSANTYILTVNTDGSRNAQSMVLLLDYGNYRGIFAGDAEQDTEEAAYQAYGALMEDTTVLLASHHGAHTHGSNHEAWITATNPHIVVFSAGMRYGHPRREVVERYQAVQDVTVPAHRLRWGLSSTEYEEGLTTQKPLYVTKENGAIVIRTNGRTWRVECSLESGCY